ncbi:MAG: cation diffusion facilitator family transporter [Pseudomonadota bacterium]|nr:cation diffusion facilitator family transporter [Pseudomonadota bacterium]
MTPEALPETEAETATETSPGATERLRRHATYASVGVAVTLIGAKLGAYLVTDSVAMLSSLLDSTIDLMSSLVTVYGVASALRPPDYNHRFGHGKAEPLAALAQAAFIAGSSVLLSYEAINRLYHPHDLQNERLGYIVMGVAILLTGALVWFQNHVVQRTSSLAIKADRLHYIGDLVINITVIGSFALYQGTGITWFDPIFALIIAAGLTVTAFHIARHALDILMDHELPDNDRARIKAIVEAQDGVRGLHDMRTRSDSDRAFMELHVEMDPLMTLRDAHVVSDKIIQEVCRAFPGADIIVHQDPEGLGERVSRPI